MIELFRDPKIEWTKTRKRLVPLSIVLLLAGAVSVFVRGFNLGVDFDGGTLITVRFKEPQSPERVRTVLGDGGIDTNKVTIQSDVSRPNEMLIRAPQTIKSEAEQRVDEDKRAIIRALQSLSPGDTSAGKINVNSIDAEGIAQELRQHDPLGIANDVFQGEHPYSQVGNQIIALRNGSQKGYISDSNLIQGLAFNVPNKPDFDQSKVKSALMERFYAGKIDLNTAGTREIEEALNRIDPLGTGGGARETYATAARAIAQYRKDRDGVIGALNEIQVRDVPADLLSKMEPYFTTGGFGVISADIVGPQVGKDLQERAIYVTLAALAGMLIYVAFRFEWIYGVAAVVAVFHDVLVTLGIFSLFRGQPGWEINLTVVAALLTLVGYSMNDTIVIFDRIRENLRLRRRDSLIQITNDSINQTLSRTVITNGLTFISVVAIVLFGGEVLRGFGLALTIGIIVGTYSTVAVASPIMLWWQYLTGGKGRTTGARVEARAGEARLAKV
jgi:preprotein translocase subunit SecF